MKKVMILITLVTLGFSNAMLASGPSSNVEELLDGPVNCCKNHHHFLKCRRGPTGPQGPRGPTGPRGPVVAQFISLFALEQQTIASGDPILFDAVSAQHGPIIWPGANNGEIRISKAGTYQISFATQPVFNARISLRLNNVNVPGGTLSTDLSLPFAALTIDVVIPANSTISLVNTGNAPINLQSAGPDPEATIAFIEIHRIL